MANIFDYLEWRGDLTFEADPFNEIDNYILSKIPEPDYGYLIPGDNTYTFQRDVAIDYYLKNGKERTDIRDHISKHIQPLLLKLREYRRFYDLRLSGYRKLFNADDTEQFCAVCAVLPDGTVYVSYRGTDDTLIGWKEDLLLTVTDETKAQRDALEYLEWVAENYEGELIVGGHSKGGNLAIYASAMVGKEIQNRIKVVYNNDGPGFQEKFLSTEGYLAIKDKVITLMPQSSIVGTILYNDTRKEILKCTRQGTNSHDGFNWEVRGKAFVRVPGLNQATIAYDNSLKDILNSLDYEQRCQFIDALFDTLGLSGATTLSDITGMNLFGMIELSKNLYKDQDIHKTVEKYLELLLKNIIK